MVLEEKDKFRYEQSMFEVFLGYPNGDVASIDC